MLDSQDFPINQNTDRMWHIFFKLIRISVSSARHLLKKYKYNQSSVMVLERCTAAFPHITFQKNLLYCAPLENRNICNLETLTPVLFPGPSFLTVGVSLSPHFKISYQPLNHQLHTIMQYNQLHSCPRNSLH